MPSRTVVELERDRVEVVLGEGREVDPAGEGLADRSSHQAVLRALRTLGWGSA